MNKLFQIACLTLSLIGVTPAIAGNTDYDYMCQVGHKSYPVMLDTGHDDDCDGETTSCTITWRGKIFTNIKPGDQGCKAEYVGDGIDLCAQTKGIAHLTVGGKTFYCRMPH